MSTERWGRSRTKRLIAEEFRWKRDLIARVEVALGDQLTLSFAEIDGRLIQMFEPRVSMPVRIPEEEPLYLYPSAFPQELPSS